MTPSGIYYPGFQRRLQSLGDDVKAAASGPERASA